MEDICRLDSEKQCCCSCRHHMADMSHPDTDGKSILHQRGWICLAPDLDGAFSDWSEHGLCEMWNRKHQPLKETP
jgi:hypothetical protein